MKKLFLILGFIFIYCFQAESQNPDFHFDGVVIGSFASDPVTGIAGQLYWNTVSNKFRKHNGTLWSDLVTVGGASIYEAELTNGQNNINVGFNLESTTLVYFNGKLVPNSLWSGEGTQILNLSLDTKLHDNLTVKN